MNKDQFLSAGRFSIIAAVAILGLLSVGCCKKSNKSHSNNCPSKFNKLSGVVLGSETSCKCPAGSATGTVWGSDIYTTDSSICAAARHAGVIGPSGGTVRMKKVAGCKSYQGTTRNGVHTSSWPSYPSSFYFIQPGKPAPTCFQKPATSSKGTCPSKFQQATLPADKTLRCTCSPSQTTHGSVWGTITYTTDSSVCRAAVHAGVITSAGGPIEAKLTSGCKRYKGTTHNGVRSSNWGRYKTSFYFPSKTNGLCQ